MVYGKTGLKTMMLVEEYDNPLFNSKNLETDKGIYSGFFSVLKSAGKYLRFVFAQELPSLPKQLFSVATIRQKTYR